MSTGTLLVPGVAKAVTSSVGVGSDSPGLVDKASDASVYVEFSDPESKFVDGALARVSIYNNSDREVLLSHLSMSDVETEQGVYKINSRLHRSPVAVGPEGVYHFWLAPSPTDEAKETPNYLTSQSTQLLSLSGEKTEKTKLELRVVRGESVQVAARYNRVVDALVEYKAT